MTSPIKILEDQLASARNPEEQLKITNQLSAALRVSDPVRALALSKKAMGFCKHFALSSAVPSEDVIFCYLQSGEICLQSGFTLSALEQFLTLEALLPEETSLKTFARLYPNIAQTYQLLEMPEKALHYLEKALALINYIENQTHQADVMHALGEAYFNTGAYPRSLIYLNKGLRLSEELDNKQLLINILEKLSKTYFYQKENEQALETCSDALKLAKTFSARKLPGIMIWQAMLLENLKENEQAVALYQEALEIAKTEDLHEQIIEILYHHASLNLKNDSLDLCISQLKQALQTAESSGWTDDLEKIHKTLSEAYRQMGNHKEALFCFQQYHYHHEKSRETRFDRLLKVRQIENHTGSLKQEKNILSSFSVQQNTPVFPSTESVIGKTAVSDPLTGLYNRRYFLKETEKKLEQAVQLGRQLSIILINVNHFEQINELHGRLLGDQVLFFIADRICSTLRETDTSARFGGDEFAILLPDSSKYQTENVAQRLLKEVAMHPFSIGGETIQVTLSIGIGRLKSGENISMQKLLSRTIEALQQSKQNGRNQINHHCD